MIHSHWTTRWGVLTLGLLLGVGSTAPGQQPLPPADPVQEGVQVQGRGPVHEAYADPAVNRPAPPVVAKRPPDPIDEMPPEQRPEGDNVQWLPGYWAFDDETRDYLWVSGCWRTPSPGKQWMPGHWAEVVNGYQWVPGFWSDAGQAEAALVPQPPASIDTGPSTPAPNVDSVYIGGSWVYQTSRFAWRPGFWYVPKPGWVWVPARYVWTPGGWIFVDGFWDYPLANRGLLFAPVVIDVKFRARPRWVFRPQVVVYNTALVGCLFVRPSTGIYCFGDYFDPRYRKLGYVAWVNYRPTKYTRDPLYTVTLWRHRSDPAWGRTLNTLYVNRYSGTVARPPLSLVHQNTIIKNTKVTNVRNVTVLAPINRVDKTAVKLRPVSPSRLAQEQKSVQQLRSISSQRQRITTQVTPRGPKAVRPAERPAKVALPRYTPVIKPSTTIKAPALPPAARTPVRPAPRKDARPAKEKGPSRVKAGPAARHGNLARAPAKKPVVAQRTTHSLGSKGNRGFTTPARQPAAHHAGSKEGHPAKAAPRGRK